MSNSVLKNKKSTYFLLPVTLGIWGFIGYKVYQYINSDDEALPLTENLNPLNTEKMAADTFAVFNNYRDPFLGNDGKEMASMRKNSSSPSNYTGGNTNKAPKKNTNPVPAANVNTGWPKISYNGMMVNESKKQSIAFLSIDGVSQRVKAGDVINGLKVVSFDQNGITIQRGKEKKVIGK